MQQMRMCVCYTGACEVKRRKVLEKKKTYPIKAQEQYQLITKLNISEAKLLWKYI